VNSIGNNKGDINMSAMKKVVEQMVDTLLMLEREHQAELYDVLSDISDDDLQVKLNSLEIMLTLNRIYREQTRENNANS
jgi:hypothetical protein